MVQGKVLKTLSKIDTTVGRLLATRQLVATLNESRMSRLLSVAITGSYEPSDAPQAGDTICILRGCPELAFLRTVRDHFIVVG